MALRKAFAIDGNGRDVMHMIDDDGVIIHTQTKQEVWVSEGEYVFVGKKNEVTKIDAAELENLGREPEYARIYATNMRYLIEKLGLSVQERAVLFSLIPYIDWKSNFIVDPATDEPMSGREIAKKTGINKTTVNNALASLKRRGVLAAFESGNSGNSKHYVINTSLAWKGRRSTKEYHHVTHFSKNGLDLPVDVKYAKVKVSN